MTKIVARPDINMFQSKELWLTAGIWINNENSEGHSRRRAQPRQRHRGWNKHATRGGHLGPSWNRGKERRNVRNGTGVGGENKTRGHRPSLRSLDIPPTVAHLFRAPATGEDAEGLPLGGLEQLSRGSLPQRGNREGSGAGGGRP